MKETSQPYPRPAYAWYVVGVLTLAYIFSFIDRQILSLLVEPIKADLGISDTRMSLLLGLSFALFYTVLGIPIARLADVKSRRAIIGAGIFLWSLMTVLCGLSRNYWQLFLARMGVGVGEAALSPAALSMISDYFPRERIGRAISVYKMGISSGQGIAIIVGATVLPLIAALGSIDLPLLGELKPWQAVFVVVGVPGILLAGLLFTVREPVRRHLDGRSVTGSERSIPMRTVIRYLLENRGTYLRHFIGMSVLTIMAYGIGSWIPAFLVRSYGLDTIEFSRVLTWLGVIVIVSGAIGTLLGGQLADRLGRRYADGYIRAVLIGVAVLIPGYGLFALMPTPELALLLLVPATLGGAIPTAAGTAALMLIAPSQMRAQVSALYYFVINLIGLAVGPTSVALITDFVLRDEADLRYSITIVAFIAGICAAVLLWSLLAPYRRTLAQAQDWAAAVEHA
ncbi:MAG TPA: MFS transporter [Steroidobacteraceae bacterium]|nr:MFS transporter [Steroidobacteraceae bacterium]